MAYKVGTELPFDEVFARICKKTGISTLAAFAKALGIASPPVSRQKKLNIFPTSWLVTIAAKYSLDMNYLAFGEEMCCRQTATESELEAVVIGYLQQGFPEVSSKISLPERAIIVGEVKALLDRLAQHLKLAK